MKPEAQRCTHSLAPRADAQRALHRFRPTRRGYRSGSRSIPRYCLNTRLACSTRDRTRRRNLWPLRARDRLLPQRRHLARAEEGVGCFATVALSRLRRANLTTRQHPRCLVAVLTREVPPLWREDLAPLSGNRTPHGRVICCGRRALLR